MQDYITYNVIIFNHELFLKHFSVCIVFKGSSGHSMPLSVLEHCQLPFPAGTQTPTQTYHTSHSQSECDSIFSKVILVVVIRD